MRRLRRILLLCLPIPLTAIILAFIWLQTSLGHRQLASLIAWATQGTSAQVTIGEVDGSIPSNIVLKDVRLADTQGIWLIADRVQLSWSPLKILSGNLSVDLLQAETITVTRTPIIPPTSSKPAKLETPALPYLPVDIELQRLVINHVNLPASLAGNDMLLQVDAAAMIHTQGSLSAKLDIHRTDNFGGPDNIKANIQYDAVTDRLSVDVRAAEPQSGSITRIMGLEGQHNLSIQMAGDAPLSNWAGHLDAILDGTSLVQLVSTIRGEKAERHIDLSLTANLSMIAPEKLHSLVNELKVTANATVNAKADGAEIQLDRFTLDSEVLHLMAQGSISPSGDNNLQLQMRNSDSGALAAFVPDLRWKSATITADITGKLASPRLKIDGSLENVAYAGSQIGRLTLSATGTSDDPQAPISIIAEVKASDILPKMPELQAVTAGDIDLTTTVMVSRDGDIDAKSMKLTSRALQLEAQGRAKTWGAAADVTAKASIADLTNLRDLAGMPIKGGLQLDIQATRSSAGTSVALSAVGSSLASGQLQLDRLLGPTPTLAIKATQSVDQKIVLELANFHGEGAALSAKGHMTLAELAFDLTGSVPNLASIDRDYAGDLSVKIDVGGSPEQPSINGAVKIGKLTAAGLTVKNLVLTAQSKYIKSFSTSVIRGKASLNDLPLTLASDVSLTGAGNKTVNIDGLNVQLGQTSLTGKLVIKDGLVSGRTNLTSPEIGELKPIARVDVKGSLKVDTLLTTDKGAQDINLSLTGNNLGIAGASTIGQAVIDAKINDVRQKPVIKSHIIANAITVSSQKLDSIKATLDGALTNLAFTLKANGPTLSADIAGIGAKLDKSEQLVLQKLTAQLSDQKISLLHPATIEHRADRLTIGDLALQNGDGQINLTGSLTPTANQLDLTIKNLSLAILTAFMPQPRIDGQLDGTLHLIGSNRNPDATIALQLDHVSSKNLSIPPTSATLNATWRNGTADAKADIKLASQAAPLHVTSRLPLTSDPATGFPKLASDAQVVATVTGKVDLAIANSVLLDSASRVTGEADIDLKLNGPLAHPNAAGRLTIVNASYGNLRSGTRIQAIQATIIANGTHIDVQTLTAKTPGNGVLGGSGSFDIGDKRNVSLHITAQNAQLLDNAMATAIADADLTVATLHGQDLAMTGKIKVERAEIRIPDHFSGSVEEIEVTERNVAAKSAKPRPQPQAPPQTAQAAPGIHIALDLEVNAPQQVAIRGRGLDAELGGRLHIGGDANQPAITGKLSLRHGKMDLISRSLTFDHGVVAFDGGTPIDPSLDFSAKSTAQSYDIILVVSGTATKPSITLSATPPLPQDEALARLLFGRPAGALTPIQAVQLAQATATLAGVSTGPGILDKVRQATGLDRLSLDAGNDAGSKTAATGPSLNAGRYVAPGVYLGVKQGTKAGSSAATVEIDVTPHVKVETDVGTEDTSKAGVSMQWDY